MWPSPDARTSHCEVLISYMKVEFNAVRQSDANTTYRC